MAASHFHNFFLSGRKCECAKKKMNPARAGKHQFSLASRLQSRRFCWSTGRRARTKPNSREAVVDKKWARRQVQGEGKALVWWYVRKRGSLCSLLPRMLLCVLLSSDLSCNTMKFSSASLPVLGIQKLIEHCFQPGAAVQLVQLSLGAQVKSSWPSCLWGKHWPGSCAASLGRDFLLLAGSVREVSLALHLPQELHPKGWQLWQVLLLWELALL